MWFLKENGVQVLLRACRQLAPRDRERAGVREGVSEFTGAVTHLWGNPERLLALEETQQP